VIAHRENHFMNRIGWLRPALLGANDGIVSTASLILGVAAAVADRHDVVVAGAAGLVAGAMSMAAGEYVSVSSQADTEAAALAKERAELASDPQAEEGELAGIYMQRGLTPDLARQVARQLTERDALAAHARDELGMVDLTTARPVQAALCSAASFAIGAAVPLALAAFSLAENLRPTVAIASLGLLAVLGALGARAGGAPIFKAMIRVAFWGALAMAATTGLGAAFGAVASA
jgi:VIT1/CCC1 family predicted Fe2+/Mn2+ transporter